MKIAIVILNWNGKKLLEQFLPSVIVNSQNATVYVADNASTDNSVDFVKQAFPSIKIIQNTENGGYAKGYNDALKQISSKYFVLINSDIEVTENWLSPIIDLMDSDINIAACQPKLLNYNIRDEFEYAGASGGFIDFLCYPFCRGRIFQDIEKDNGQYDDITEVFWATGACLFIRSDAYMKVGGLDEDFFAHQEEIDLCWRLKHNGYKIMSQPKSVVYHVGGATLDVGSPFKTYLNFRNNLFMLFKNLSFVDLLFVLPIRLFLDGVAAFTFVPNKRGFGHFISIIKAHIMFYYNLPNLIYKRNNINKTKNLTGRMKFSIIYKNKIRRIKKFIELK